MHDILRQRLIRKIESLPEEQVYQILDYIEFLESKYGTDSAEETSGLKRFAEAMEDKLRKKSVNPAVLREAFQLISAADRVLANVSSAGKKLMEELTPGAEDGPTEAGPPSSVPPSNEPPSSEPPSSEPSSSEEPSLDQESRSEDTPPAN